MNRNVALARQAVDRFQEALAGSPDFDEGLADEYNRLRRALASSFKTMSLEAVPRDVFVMDHVKDAVTTQMRNLFEGRVGSRLFGVHGYTTPHPDLYALLAARVGEPIPGWRLRLLSGDSVHTERRTRELRDFGLDIRVEGSQDDTQYMLGRLEPDLTYGAAFQLRKNAIKDTHLKLSERENIIALAEATADLPGRKSATK